MKLEELLARARQHPLYRDRFDQGRLPVLTKAELYAGLACLDCGQGIYWSPSGGSGAAAPLYFPSTVEENRLQRRALAAWLRRVGILGPTTVALNLFSARLMYRACEIFVNYVEETGGTVLPVTFQAPDSNVLEIVKRFRPDTVMGSPARLLQLCHALPEKLEIPHLLYASEPLYRPAEQRLRDCLGVQRISSALGSAEAGVWGFTGFDDPRGRFWAPRDLVELEIVEPDSAGFGRLIVTNLVRGRHPLIRYDTGDRARLAGGDAELQGLELAGRHGQSFQFAGQSYDLEDFREALQDVESFQFVLSFSDRDQLTVRAAGSVRQELLHRIVRYEPTRMEVRVEACRPEELRKAEASGKIIPIVDHRQ